MASGQRSPLLDLIPREDAEVRMAGARSELGLRGQDQVALLMTLLEDPDVEIARQAQASLDALPAPALQSLLAGGDVPDAMREFFASRGVRPDQAPLEATPAGEVDAPLPTGQTDEPIEGEAPSDVPAAVLSSLPVVDRIKLATKGTREQRAQLIRDPNRIVAVAVLSSPKVNESEVEVFAKMASVSEDILRLIGGNRIWMKHYGVALALVRNPKTPPGMSMQLLHRLTERDVRAVAANRNVPERVRLTARRILSHTQK
jgi:hypothetical protein